MAKNITILLINSDAENVSGLDYLYLVQTVICVKA